MIGVNVLSPNQPGYPDPPRLSIKILAYHPRLPVELGPDQFADPKPDQLPMRS